MEIEVRKLPSSFRAKGFDHQVIRREGSAAIYRRGRNGITHFEVNGIRVGKLHPLDQNRDGVDTAEIYPPSTACGSDGWKFCTLKDAEARFSGLARTSAGLVQPREQSKFIVGALRRR